MPILCTSSLVKFKIIVSLTKQTESLRVGSNSDVTGQGNKLEIGEQFGSEAHPYMGRPVSLCETFLVLQALLMPTGLLGFPRVVGKIPTYGKVCHRVDQQLLGQ